MLTSRSIPEMERGDGPVVLVKIHDIAGCRLRYALAGGKATTGR